MTPAATSSQPTREHSANSGENAWRQSNHDDPAAYAARKGLSYAAFRAVGVSPTVLGKAGIKRGA